VPLRAKNPKGGNPRLLAFGRAPRGNMPDPFTHKPVPVRPFNDEWDTISSSQLYRLYPHKPRAERQEIEQSSKPDALSASDPLPSIPPPES
jgi:hypothetical protein